MNRRIAFFVALLAGAFAGSANAGPKPPQLRLPETVQPTRIALELRVVPTEDRFRGTASIDVQLKSAVDVLWLNATDLKVAKAVLELGGATIATTPIVAAPDF